jgi:hypothetical protein
MIAQVVALDEAGGDTQAAARANEDRALDRSAERIDCVIRACAQSQQLRNRADVLDAALARLKALRRESRA